MDIILRITLAGVIGGILAAVLWVAFFTTVLEWPAHQIFTTVVFIFGGAIGGMISLKAALR